MQGFNMGRYRPWDEDYRDKTFRPKKAREAPPKFGKVVRFELPFHIWCLSCNERIGQGVRFNAEKRQDGNYHTTPIWQFRCKCPSCKSYFIIRTDPQNTRYVIESGAREQLQDWNPEEVGGHPVHDPDDINEDGAFSQLEKKKAKQKDGKQQQARIRELEDYGAERWEDPYERNAELRKTFRAQKKLRLERAGRDASLRERIGWSDDIPLVGESSSDPHLSTPAIRQAFHDVRGAIQKKPVQTKSGLRRNPRRVPIMSDAARKLAGRMLAPTDAKR
ncbi:Protein saf4 [Malassezia yamatoensis]|uniref:Protein saf4 n=1 Tax=Malassezia yamatoensis TaxID=253288 RepID=A0AAJ5YTR9_9BASI|nr:Protein saf4 [Malassezia yamatoensis]